MAESSTGERTLPPSARRIERARRAGQIAFSRELVAGVAVASACLALVAGGRAGVGGLVAYVRAALSGAVGGAAIPDALRLGFDALLSTLWLPVGVVCAAVVVASLAQTRGHVSPERLRVDGSWLRPRLARLLGRDGMVAAAMDVCRLIALGAAAYLSLRSWLPSLPALAGAPAASVFHSLGAQAQRLGVGLVIVMLLLGVVDYLWQMARHRHRLQMTRNEASRELRESDGAPELKEERSRIHRALSAGIGDRPWGGCELVVSDPGRFAVALSYSGVVEDVPVVLATGERQRARNIESAARTTAVPILEEPRLAAALVLLGEGRQIPESLYRVVAEAIIRARRLSS